MNNKYFKIALLLFAVLTLALWMLLLHGVGNTLFGHSPYDQHTHQALAWQKGQIHLDSDVSWLELAIYKNRTYVSFPPVPTLLNFPFALIFGRNTPNTFVLLIFAWISMLLAFFLLLKLTGNRILSFLMAFSFFWGTNILYLSLRGDVWHQGQLYGLFFAIAAFSILFHARYPWHLSVSALMLGFSVGCRPFYLFTLPFFLYYSTQRFPLIKTVYFTIIGLAIPGFLLATYNFIRFDSIFEFGHRYLPRSQSLPHGVFSIHYFIRNVTNALVVLPKWNFDKGILDFDGAGTAIWLHSPVLVLCFFFFFSRSGTALEKTIGGISLVAIWVMLLLHESNGWFQFGYRYSVDLIVLFLIFFGRTFRKTTLFLIPVCFYSILINIYGAFWFFALR